MLKTILSGLIVVILFSVFLVIIGYGMSKVEAVECIKWQQQAEKYPSFYWTEWQKEQCNID